MRDVSVQDLGSSQYLVSYGDFSFRVAVESGVSYVGFSDLAECCGYKAGSGRKLAERTSIPKVKLYARHLDGRRTGRVSPMWFLTVDDAIQFVEERTVDDSFRGWFTGYADTLRNLPASGQRDTAHAPDQPVQDQPKALAAKPNNGVNISPELIDRIIVDLLMLKRGIAAS